MKKLFILLLLPLLSFGQFFKYSTVYTSFTMGTSMVERENYIAIDRGYEEIEKKMCLIGANIKRVSDK